jgi:hypothetical protein
MRNLLVIAAMTLMVLTTAAWPADAPPAQLAPGPVTVTGKLMTGIMAIGGETTGTIITIPKQGTYELDIRGNKELQKAAADLKGKQVKVTGTLAIRAGVEVRQRRIIKVDTLAAAPEEKK